MQTLLDPQETPVAQEDAPPPPPSAPPADKTDYPFRHAGWRHARETIRTAFNRLMLPWHRVEAWDDCGRGHWLMKHKTAPNRYKLVPSACHDRLCIPCQRSRSHRITDNLKTRLTERPYRMLTLTLRSSSAPLNDQVTRLLRSFRNLRNTSLWKDRVEGGAAFLEVTKNADTGMWHPHLHCILEGRYYLKESIKAAWLAATGDSHVIDIRLVKSRERVIHYVTKYVTKHTDTQIVADPEALDELILALRGRRLLITFGTWHKWRLLQDPDEKHWDLICHLNVLLLGMAHDDEIGQDLLRHIEGIDDWKKGCEFEYVRAPPP